MYLLSPRVYISLLLPLDWVEISQITQERLQSTNDYYITNKKKRSNENMNSVKQTNQLSQSAMLLRFFRTRFISCTEVAHYYYYYY